MNKWIKILTVLVALETLLIGIYCCSYLDINSESSSVLISALGVLVTFLVAWQIWQTMASREEIKEARLATNKANKVAEDVNSLNSEFKASLKLLAAYQSSSNGLSFLLNERHYKAFHLFATAIVDSLAIANDRGRCAMSSFVNLGRCMDFDEKDYSMNEYKENWDNVVLRLGEIEDALHRAEQENLLFQAFAKDEIEKFKNSARAKGFKI